MNARKLGIAVAAATISFGLLAITTAPAHAVKPGKGDTSWGYSAPTTAAPVKLK